MRIIFLPSTCSDLMWMRTYYADLFPEGAKHAVAEYSRVCKALRASPFIGHPIKDAKGVREFAIPRTPFSFIYRIVDDRIEVLRIWDQRGDRSKLADSQF